MAVVTITVDKSRAVGPIKPMHCVNNFPGMRDTFNDLYADLGIPYARLHDTAHMVDHLVDIHCVFPDFDADENDEASYDFAFTDFYIKKLHDLGTKAFYRLGESIENYCAIKRYHTYPPKDYEKWARICEHIILHYNEGWANGFHFDLDYWEIWNEPENYEEIEKNQMWGGTFEEYLKLYEVAANYLKKRFPHLKIGGYGSCGFYAIRQGEYAEAAHISPRKQYHTDCAERFLSYISSPEHKAPLDFFSYHSYAALSQNLLFARYGRQLLDKYGFTDTETNLDEWNPSHEERGTLLDASNVIANMLVLQNEPLDMMMYYDFRFCSYCGAFDYGGPLKTYYAFKAFSALYALKTQVACEVAGSIDEVFAVAAYNGSEGALVIANNCKEAVSHALLVGITPKEAYRLGRRHDLARVATPTDAVRLEAFETMLIRF